MNKIKRQYAKSAIIHGVKPCITSALPPVRLFWGLVFLISTAGFIWQITLLIMRFMEFETIVHVKLGFEQLAFPSVTICNLNAYKISEIRKVPEFAALLSVFESSKDSGSESARKKRDYLSNYTLTKNLTASLSLFPNHAPGSSLQKGRFARSHKPGSCDPIVPKPGAIITYDLPLHEGRVEHLTKAIISCGENIDEHIGAVSDTCADGSWKGSPYYCTYETYDIHHCGPLVVTGVTGISYNVGPYEGSRPYNTIATVDGCSISTEVLSNGISATCKCDGWKHSDGIGKYCSKPCPVYIPPHNFNNERIEYSDPNRIHGSTATVYCDDVDTVMGRPLNNPLTCNNGAWPESDVWPICMLPCPISPKLVNANGPIYSDPTYRKTRSTAQYTCNKNHVMSGGNPRSCLHNGRWTGMPKCRTPCLSDVTAPENVNSTIYNHANRIHGSTATLTCASTFVATGSNIVTCNDATWSASILTCLKPCQPFAMTTISNGGTPIYSNADRIHGSTVKLTCNSTYVPNEGSSTSTCTDGVWSASTLTCLDPCPDADTPVGAEPATYQTSDRIHGSTLQYQCKLNHVTNGQPENRTCTDGVWSTTAFECRAPCSNVDVPKHSKDPPFYSNLSKIHGTVAEFECLEHYIPTTQIYEHRIRECNNGTWSEPTGLQCYAPCPTLILTSGSAVTYSNPNKVHASTGSFACSDGSATVRTCQNGTWSASIPPCPGECDPLSLKVDGLVVNYNTGGTGSSNMVAHFQCSGSNPKSSYVASPVSSECQDDRSWRLPLPSECLEVSEEATKQLATVTESLNKLISSSSGSASTAAAIELTIVDTFAYFASNIEKKTLYDIGYTKDQLVSQCYISKKPCEEDDFTVRADPSMNNCYSFNYKLPVKYFSTGVGAAEGLIMNVFINQSEYIAISPNAGVKIVVHDQDDTVIPETEGIMIAPGYASSIMVKKIRSEKLGYPYGNCITTPPLSVPFYFETKYSIEGCHLSCFSFHLVQKCGCGDPRLPLPPGGKVCSVSDRECVTAFSSDKLAISKLTETCNCPEPCIKSTFQMTPTMSVWPAQNHPIPECEHFGNSTVGLSCRLEYRKNNARIEVFYTGLNYEAFSERSAFGPVALLSAIGSQMGLWIGMSVMTLAEFIALFVDILKHLATRK